jgi:surface-anchored protein
MKIIFPNARTHSRGENFPNDSRIEPLNRSAAGSQTSRSSLASAATGFQHSRAPVQGEGEAVHVTQTFEEARCKRASIAQTLFRSIFSVVFLLPVALSAQVTYLTNQHMDFRLQYDASAMGSNRLNIILGYDPGQRATNDQVYIVGNTNARITIPSNPNFAFLGAAGAPVWVLPQSQNTALPYLGISAEDIPNGVFADPMALELVSVEGPGNFFAWAVSGAGQPPDVKFIATNGVVAPDFYTAHPFIGSHEHNNWGFSTNGLYRVTLRANGQFLGDATNTIGRDVAWAFQILPLRPWEEWISTNWPPATASGTNGPSADPDGDGIPNALEYTLGLNPHVAATTGLPTFSLITTNGETYGVLTFTRVKAATDIDYLPSVRSDLNSSAWTTLTDVVSVVDHGDTETVTVRDAVPRSASAARFYQFRARLNYP